MVPLIEHLICMMIDRRHQLSNRMIVGLIILIEHLTCTLIGRKHRLKQLNNRRSNNIDRALDLHNDRQKTPTKQPNDRRLFNIDRVLELHYKRQRKQIQSQPSLNQSDNESD